MFNLLRLTQRASLAVLTFFFHINHLSMIRRSQSETSGAAVAPQRNHLKTRNPTEVPHIIREYGLVRFEGVRRYQGVVDTYAGLTRQDDGPINCLTRQRLVNNEIGCKHLVYAKACGVWIDERLQFVEHLGNDDHIQQKLPGAVPLNLLDGCDMFRSHVQIQEDPDI